MNTAWQTIHSMVWFGMVWYGLVWYGMVCSIMSNASLCFILDEGLETFLEIRDLEIYILLIYMVTRLQHYRTYRLLALFMDFWVGVQITDVPIKHLFTTYWGLKKIQNSPKISTNWDKDALLGRSGYLQGVPKKMWFKPIFEFLTLGGVFLGVKNNSKNFGNKKKQVL